MKNKLFKFIFCFILLFILGIFSACDLVNKKEKYDIYLIVNGEIFDTISTSGNETISIPKIEFSDEYEFVGWYYDSLFTKEFNVYDYLNKDLTSDISIYAYLKLKLDLTLDGFTLDNNKYTLVVDNSTDTFDFSNRIRINNKLTYSIKNINGDNLNNLVSLDDVENNFIITISDSLNNCKDYNVSITKTKAYTITFDTDGGSKIDPITVKENEIINSPKTEKDGYTFVGWDYDFSKPITSDLLVKASWNIINYNITYVLNGGNNNSANLDTYNVENIFSLKEATKDGYNFAGWYSDPDFNNPFSTLTIGDVTIYAKYSTAKTYTLSYYLNGGVNNTLNPTTYTVEDNNIVLQSPTRVGYTFDGWYKNVLLTLPIDTIYTSVCANYTLYAKWTANKYYIYLDSDGGVVSASTIVIRYDQSYTLPTPTKDNAEFDGWYNGSIKVESGTFKETNDLTLKAKWIPLYSITYYDGNNVLNLSPSYYNGKTNISLPTITKDGYNFMGWYKENTFDKKVDEIKIGDSGNITLYAKFIEKEPVEVTVMYDTDGGILDGYDVNGFDYSNPSYQAKATMYLDYDSTNGYYASIHTTTGNLYFTYIMLKETEYNNLYQIIEIAYPRSKITVSDYDLLIAWHGALKDSESYTVFNTIYANRDTFTNGYVYLTNIPSEKSSDCNIGIAFYTSDKMGSGLATVTLKEKCTLPIPTKSGYDFLGWKSSVDGAIITEYPAYVDERDPITYTALWVKEGLGGTSLADAIAYINNYMIDYSEVSESIDLITEAEGCSVSWTSSNTSIINNKGLLTKPYNDASLTLTASISDGTNTENINFVIKVKGQMKDLSNGVVAGYFYYSQSPITDYTYKNVDIMYLAFANIVSDGSISNYDSLKAQAKIKAEEAHKYGTRVVISIQHKTDLTDFTTVASSDELCEVFATNCMNLLIDTGCDGIDLDWEWPSTSQAAMFTRFTKAIYTKIKSVSQNYLLTSACGSYQSTRYDLTNTLQYFDYINIMTYDMQVGTASFQNALYKSNGNSSYYCDGSVTAYLKLVPANKLILGVPFYGRVFTGCTTGLKSGSFSKAVNHTYIIQNYLNSLENIAKYRVWDDTAKVPYIYDSTNGVVITYDDEESISIKADYCKSKGLAGMMYWQDSQDYGDTLLTAMVDGITKNYRN